MIMNHSSVLKNIPPLRGAGRCYRFMQHRQLIMDSEQHPPQGGNILRSSTFIFAILFFFNHAFAQSDQTPGLRKPTVDDDTKFTTVGSIGMTISNFGTIGDGFATQSPSDQPSCEYPKGSGIEHMFVGGLWVGGRRDDGSVLVTTGAKDIPSLRDVAAGFEFTNTADPNDVVRQRSSLIENPFYKPEAISHQDFIADFTDSNVVVPGTTIRIPQHTPIGLAVHLESYAWDFPFADAFVILNYTIKNVGGKNLNDVYVSLWADLVVRNVNITPPRVGASFYQHKSDGYIDSSRMVYTFDYDGDPGFTDRGLYAAMKHLGATPQANDTTYRVRSGYNAWLFRDASDPVLFSPQTDIDNYEKQRAPLDPITIASRIKGQKGNFMTMLTTGPFKRLAPDSSINVVFAVICASKSGDDANFRDTEQSRQNLMTNAFWAQTAYNGEDRNGNNKLDPGEDIDRDGKLDRYVLPTPPTTPRVKIVPSDREATIYWDRSAEESVDFISGKKDFEGYRVYRTQLGEDLPGKDLFSSFSLIAEYDSVNGIGYDTGFELARLPEPITFGETALNPLTGQTEKIFYHYRLVNKNLLNGWQYAYAVTAFDGGDPEIRLQSLESSRLSNAVRVFPGSTTAEAQRAANAEKDISVGVYPNPYRVQATWDGNLERDRKFYFFNLPASCEVRIYTLAGDLVDSFTHDAATYQGEGIQWTEKFSRGNRVYAGGEHAWDLVTKDDQALASGLYFYTVEDLATGKVQRGRFLVIK